MAARKKVDTLFRIRLHAIRDHLTGKQTAPEETIEVMGYEVVYTDGTEDQCGSFMLMRANGTSAYMNPDSSQVRDCVQLDAVQKPVNTKLHVIQ